MEVDRAIAKKVITIGRKQKVSRVLSFTPFDLIDLFFNFQTLQIIKLGFMGLELGVKTILAILFLLYRSMHMLLFVTHCKLVQFLSFMRKKVKIPRVSSIFFSIPLHSQ